MPKYVKKNSKTGAGVSKKTAKAVRKIVRQVNRRDQETKTCIPFPFSTQVRDDGQVLYFGNVAQGTAVDERVGVQIALKSFTIRYTMQNSYIHPNGANPLTSNIFMRVVLFRDMDFDGSNAATTASILASADVRSPYNPTIKENPKRYNIFYDKLVSLATTGVTATTSSYLTYVPYVGTGDKRISTLTKKFNMVGKSMKFTGPTNLVSDGGSGSIWGLFLTNVPLAAGGVVNRLDLSTEFEYTDA